MALLRDDPFLGQNVLVLKRGEVLRQKVLKCVVLGQTYLPVCELDLRSPSLE